MGPRTPRERPRRALRLSLVTHQREADAEGKCSGRTSVDPSGEKRAPRRLGRRRRLPMALVRRSLCHPGSGAPPRAAAGCSEPVRSGCPSGPSSAELASCRGAPARRVRRCLDRASADAHGVAHARRTSHQPGRLDSAISTADMDTRGDDERAHRRDDRLPRAPDGKGGPRCLPLRRGV